MLFTVIYCKRSTYGTIMVHTSQNDIGVWIKDFGNKIGLVFLI